MKQGPLTYKYVNLKDKLVRYGEVTIQIVASNNGTIVTNACEWETLKKSYPDFIELDILKTWKQSAINTAVQIINNSLLPPNIEVIITDIVGVYTDTCPSDIGAAITMGIFDYCEKPLSQNDLESLDNFVNENRDPQIIPDYSQLQLSVIQKEMNN